jgi:hypothetical protein
VRGQTTEFTKETWEGNAPRVVSAAWVDEE